MEADLNRTVYVYDGTFDGLLTAVFEAWTDAAHFGDILQEAERTPGFFDVSRTIPTDPDKARRVRKWLDARPAGTGQRVRNYFFSEDVGRERRIYWYLRACSRFGARTDSVLTCDAVSDFLQAEKRFFLEERRMYEFTRFSLLKDNVLFAEISPDHNVLSGLGRFFLDRMPGQRFLICDTGRDKAVLSDGFRLAFAEDFYVETVRESEEAGVFEDLWRAYLQALTIEERRNGKLQRQMVPLKYRKHMTEFKEPIRGEPHTMYCK